MHQPSVWELETFFAPRDIIIIGSGVVGLWSAYYLKRMRPEANILIVERGIIPTGASTRNAGFACFGSPTELLQDARLKGEEAMLEIVAIRHEGLRRIREVFKKSEIGFEQTGSYELVTEAQYPRLKQLKNDLGWLNITLRKALDDHKVFRLADKKINRFGFKGVSHLVESRSEGQLHSGKLVQALLRKVQSMGVQVLTQTEVTGFEKVNGKILLHSSLRHELRTEQLLVCTNAFTQKLLPKIEITPARGQVLVTAPLRKVPFAGTFHYDEGYYYFRNLGNRVLLGGARNKAFQQEQSDEMVTTDLIQQELERFLREVVIPGQPYTIEHRWSGIMAMGPDKMPVIKKVKKDVYCAVRMSGMGVAIAPVVGETVARMMVAG